MTVGESPVHILKSSVNSGLFYYIYIMEDIKSVNDQAFFTSINMTPTNIIIQNNNTTVEIRDNGDFLINDRLVETDIEVYESFKKLLGLLPYEQR